MYSLKGGGLETNLYYLRYSRAYGILCGGGLHWVVSRESNPERESMVVAFDLGLRIIERSRSLNILTTIFI